jgi:hypothetical protein
MHTYFGTVQDRSRGIYVYVPPQYYTEINRKFPVLYLWYSLWETEWTRYGRANFILDNLIAVNAVFSRPTQPSNCMADYYSERATSVALWSELIRAFRRSALLIVDRFALHYLQARSTIDLRSSLFNLGSSATNLNKV